jgi:branched-subunit amino acid transport protein AzlD
MSAWIAIICIGIGSLAFRMTPLAFAGRTASPFIDRIIKDAGVAAGAAITVASFDRAAHTGNPTALAIAGTVGLVLTMSRASTLRVVALGTGVYIVIAHLLR